MEAALPSLRQRNVEVIILQETKLNGRIHTRYGAGYLYGRQRRRVSTAVILRWCGGRRYAGRSMGCIMLVLTW